MYTSRKGKKEKNKKDGQQEEREGKERNKCKAEKERAHRARKAVYEKKGGFSACQARNGSDSLSCRAKMPQTKREIARAAYHDFHSRKHFAFGMPVEEAGIPLTFACLRASLKGMFPLARRVFGTVGLDVVNKASSI